MTWNYRIIEHYSPESDETYYVLTEVFYDYSDDNTILGDDKEEIIRVLEMMLKDAKKDQPTLTPKDFE
jgi:glutathionyl-hydroquinone reductase